MFAALYPQNTAQNDYYRLMADQLAKGRAEGGAIETPESNAPAGASYHDGNGNFYDADGYLVTG
jgi:hypothetical protein